MSSVTFFFSSCPIVRAAHLLVDDQAVRWYRLLFCYVQIALLIVIKFACNQIVSVAITKGWVKCLPQSTMIQPAIIEPQTAIVEPQTEHLPQPVIVESQTEHLPQPEVTDNLLEVDLKQARRAASTHQVFTVIDGELVEVSRIGQRYIYPAHHPRAALDGVKFYYRDL